MASGSCGSGRPAGPEHDPGAVEQVEAGLVARAHQVLRLVLVLRHHAAHVRADARVGDEVVRAPRLTARLGLEVAVDEVEQGDLRVGRAHVALGERDERAAGGQGVLGDRHALGVDEPGAGRPGRGAQAVPRARPEGAEEDDLAEGEHGAADDEQAEQEAAAREHAGVLLQGAGELVAALRVLVRDRVRRRDDLVPGQVAAPVREGDAEPEQGRGEEAADPAVAGAEDERDGEADGRDDGDDQAEAHRPAGRAGGVRRRAGGGHPAHGTAFRDFQASQTASRTRITRPTAPKRPSGTGPRYHRPAPPGDSGSMSRST